MTHEAALQSAVVDALKAIGCRVLVNVVVKKGNRVTGMGKGSPDLLVVIPRVYGSRPAYVWLELKIPKQGRVSEAQVEWHADARRYEEDVKVVRSVNEALATIQAIRFGRAA